MNNNITLSQLAKNFNINKSALHYWTKKGLITPDIKLSNVFIFDKDKTIKTLKRLKKI